MRSVTIEFLAGMSSCGRMNLVRLGLVVASAIVSSTAVAYEDAQGYTGALWRLGAPRGI